MIIFPFKMGNFKLLSKKLRELQTLVSIQDQCRAQGIGFVPMIQDSGMAQSQLSNFRMK